MTLIVRDLYQSILRANVNRYHELRVITGYTSGSFLEKVVTDFPDVKITIYVGMALQGITRSDHQEYQRLTHSGKASVWYVSHKPMIHQKIVDFINEKRHQTYIGSANFSIQGFLNQVEVMTITNNNVDALFKTAKSQAILCTDERVNGLITLVEDGDAPVESKEIEEVSTKKVNENFTDTSSKNNQIRNQDVSIPWLNPNHGLDLSISGIKIPIVRSDYASNYGLNSSNPFLSLKGVNMFELNRAERFSVIINGKQDIATITNFLELRLTKLSIKEELAKMLNLNQDQAFTMENTGGAVILLQARPNRSKTYNLYLVK